MPPLFYNKTVLNEAVPQHMKDNLDHCKRIPMHNQQKLAGVLSAQKIVLYTPLLKWYLDHGLKITALYQTTDYVPQNAFMWFVEKVMKNSHKGDEKSELAFLAEVFKLLGNSAYGKLIEALEMQYP